MPYDFFLKVDGIEGEAQDAKHKNEIQLESWSYLTQAGVVRGPGAAATVHDANFTSVYSKASPKLMLACANGSKISKAVLTARKAGKEQEDFLKVTFSDVLVSSYQIQGRAVAKGTIPSDRFSFNFARINFEYKIQNQSGILSGTVSSSYSVKEEKGQGQ